MTTQVNTSQVTSPIFLRRSENTFVRGIVLVTKKYDKPLQLFRPQNIKNKRGALDTTYDRLVILGEIISKECFTVIAESAQKIPFSFGDTLLTVASIVDVKEPVFSNFVSAMTAVIQFSMSFFLWKSWLTIFHCCQFP